MLGLLALSTVAAASSPYLALGYTHREQRDLQFSPLRYSAHAPTLRVGIDTERSSAWLDVRGQHWNPAGVGARAYEISEPDPLHDGETSFVIAPSPWGLGVSAGAQMSWEVGPLDVGPRLVSEAHYATVAMSTWALHETSLQARVGVTVDALSVGFWVPAAAVQTRMPYGLDPIIQGHSQAGSFFRSGTHLKSWGQRQAVGADVSWRQERDGRWDLGVKGNIGWSHTSTPEDLYAIEGNLLATLWRTP